ncbi:MAG: hypothetical protein IPF96_03610 [Rhodobacter sp.]|nr:hypothetical protein [Rhodobacter sp.]
MSTWISKLLVLFVLSGCVVAGVPAGRSASTPVLGGALTAAVPPGYCIDPQASHDGRDSAVVIAGRCSSIQPVPAAAITLSLGAAGSSETLKVGARALTDWARSPAGRAALARNGKAGSVAIRETLVSDGVFLIRLEDRSVGTYWRAAVGIRGRLVMISVTPPAGGDLPPEAGREILMRVVATLKRVNATS